MIPLERELRQEKVLLEMKSRELDSVSVSLQRTPSLPTRLRMPNKALPTPSTSRNNSRWKRTS
jgi:hypothetical protein